MINIPSHPYSKLLDCKNQDNAINCVVEQSFSYLNTFEIMPMRLTISVKDMVVLSNTNISNLKPVNNPKKELSSVFSEWEAYYATLRILWLGTAQRCPLLWKLRAGSQRYYR